MSILQELLNLGLVDIGGDDSRFEKMKAASGALAKRLGEEPSLLIPATLIALDHDVDEADPIFDIVEEQVVAQWKTMRNTHTNRPRELLRSVLLEALATSLEGKPDVAGAVWCTAAGPVRHGQARLGGEAPIVERLVNNAWCTAEAEAVKRAGMAPPVHPAKRKKASTSPPTLKIQVALAEADLLPDVARTAGPSHPELQLNDPNPSWPHVANATWSHQFTPRMAAALAKAVNLGTEQLGAALKAYLVDLEKRVAEQLTTVSDINNATVAATEASRLRLEVLWWSEALYSPLLGCSYRDLPLDVAAVAAAADLAAIVPPLAPTSVIYVLGESVHRVATAKGSGSASLREHLGGFDGYANLGAALPASSQDGRCALLELVRDGLAGNQPAPEEIRKRSGLEADLQLTGVDLAMWVFRDLQARRLIEKL